MTNQLMDTIRDKKHPFSASLILPFMLLIITINSSIVFQQISEESVCLAPTIINALIIVGAIKEMIIHLQT